MIHHFQMRMKAFVIASLFLIRIASNAHGQTSFTYSTTLNGVGDVGDPISMRVWLPPSVSTIRGLIFDYPGSGSDGRNITTNGTWQARLVGMGFGIVGVKDDSNAEGAYWGYNATAAAQNVQGELNTIASLTSHPEISNAPIFLFGMSTGAEASSFIAQSAPTRTIGFFADKGGVFGDNFFQRDAQCRRIAGARPVRCRQHRPGLQQPI
jgi:hypothetical protein